MDGESVISDGAEAALRLLVEQFSIELANQAIGARHACKHASSDEALLAMLRLGYLQGAKDADAAARLDELRKILPIGYAAVEGDDAGVRERIADRLDELTVDPFEADLARMRDANTRRS